MNFLRSLFTVAWTPIYFVINPREWLRAPKRLMRISAPGLAALITFIFMVALAAVFVMLNVREATSFMTKYLYWSPLIVFLCILLPAVVHYTVSVWLQETGERFEDIRLAWEAGVKELSRKGYDLQQVPLFLIMGSESDSREAHVVSSSTLEFPIARFPSGTQPLHWYAGNEAVFVALSGVGCLTHISREAIQATREARARTPISGPRTVNPNQTYWPDEDESVNIMASRVPAAAVAATVDPGMNVHGTIDPGDDDSIRVMISRPTTGTGGERQTVRPLNPRREDLDLQQRRLAYLCRLIAQERMPVCPINGVLALLPINMILADDGGVRSLDALRRDMTTMVAQLRLRFPVVACVVGLEDDAGFQELVRRFGPDKARDFRFGKGMGSPWVEPTPYAVEALVENACAAFERSIYKFFRERESLSRPTNKLLYGLLCKMRRFLQPRLQTLMQAMQVDDDKTNLDSVPLLAALYFAGTGAKSDQQAFAKAVFERFFKGEDCLEGEVCWTRQAKATDRLYRVVAYTGFVIAGLSVAVTIVTVYSYLNS